MDRRRWIILLGSIAIGAAIFVLLRREPCPPSRQKLVSVWDASRRAEVKQAFAADRRALESVQAAFDTFASSWSTSWDQACTDTSSTAEAKTKTRVCLDGRLAHLAALTELYARAEPNAVATAGVSVERLAALGPCNENILEVPPGNRLQLALAQRKVARSEVLRRAGKHTDALAVADEAVALAQSASYPPVLAEALLARADVQRTTGKLEAAELSLQDAEAAAKQGRDFETLTRIGISYLVLVGSQPSRVATADAWVKRAEEALTQFSHPALRGDLELAVSVLRLEQGRLAEAEAAALRAHELFEKNNQRARTLDAKGILAQALTSQGKPVPAIELSRVVIAGRLAQLGHTHAQTQRARIALAQALLADDQPEEALKTLEPISEEQLAALPSMTAASALCLRGSARTRLLAREGRPDLERCVALQTTALGARHPITGGAHDALAAAWRLEADLRRAIDAHQLAVAAFGALRTPEAADAHASYAVTLLAKNQSSVANERARLALAIYDQIAADRAIDPCTALWVLAESGARLKKPSSVTDARAALGCLKDHPRRKQDLARAALTLGTLLGRSPEAIALLKTAALQPGPRQLVALDALAALRPFDADVGCAAAIEALVREPSARREKAARGCKLPRLP